MSNAPKSDSAETKPSWVRNTLTRVASALVLVPVIIALLFWGPRYGFTALAFLAIFISSAELMAMVLPDHRALRWFGTSLTVGMATLLFFAPEHALAGVAVLPGLALLGSLAAPEPIESAALRTGWLIGGPLMLGGMLVTVPLLHGYGGGWVLFAMFAAFGSDTGGYFAGKVFGKHPLHPRVSPKKTREGSVGGIVVAVLVALVLREFLLPEVPRLHAAVLAAVAAGLGQMGDLAESLIKRSTGVKDSGRIMPGHGGLLDRIDALMFTSVVTWAYVVHFVPGP